MTPYVILMTYDVTVDDAKRHIYDLDLTAL